MLSVGEARAAITRDIGACRDLLGGCGPEQAGRPSTLPGWSVLDLAQHLVWGQRLQASAWRNQRIASPDTADAPVPVGADLDATVRALDAAHADFVAELDVVTPERLATECQMPYGAMPGHLVLQIAAMEAGVHRLDLERSLDRRARLHDDVLDATAVVLTATLTALAAGSQHPPAPGTTVRLRSTRLDLTLTNDEDGWRPTSSDAHVEFTGDDEAVILFALGRESDPESGISTAGPLAATAAFKQWFPGP